MGEISEFSGWIQAFLHAYPWRRVNPIPWAPLRRPLSESRVALVSSAGLTAQGDTPFASRTRGGDTTFRHIAAGTGLRDLAETHRSTSWDRTGFDADPNVVLPLDRLDELVADGHIGEVAPRHLSLMGSITAPNRLVRHSAPEAAASLVADQVDVALLVPV